MDAHDLRLVKQAYAVTNPCLWGDVPNENLAHSEEAREILHRHMVYLYRREEGNDI
jgi:hypothetical protein